MLCRIDLGAAGVIALEEQTVRRDDAAEILDRREADRGLLAGGEPRHVAADRVLDEFRRLTVRPVDDAGPERLRPRRVFRRKGVTRARGAGKQRAARGRAGELDEAAAAGWVLV